MATEYTTIEIWVCVDEEGGYVASDDPDLIPELWNERHGDENWEQPMGRRFVKLTIRVPLPEVIELTGEVQVDESATQLKATG